MNVRDKAILLLMLGCGLHRAEVSGLLIENCDPAGRSMKLLGKGNKERIVYLPPASAQALDRWIREFRGTHPGWLFSRICSNGRIDGAKPLSPCSVFHIVCEHVRTSRIEPATPHDLRRTFATRLIEDGHDLVKVQRAMGHASVTTTARYDRR